MFSSEEINNGPVQSSPVQNWSTYPATLRACFSNYCFPLLICGKVEKLRSAIGKYTPGTSPDNSSCSAGNDPERRSCLVFYPGIFGLEKSRTMEIVTQALEELKQMATAGEPLWIRSLETGREILNRRIERKLDFYKYNNNEDLP